jgi:hypothetical protein
MSDSNGDARTAVACTDYFGRRESIYAMPSGLCSTLFALEDHLNSGRWIWLEPIRRKVLREVTRACSDRGVEHTTLDDALFVIVILDTWDTDYYWTAYLKGFVTGCVKRVLFEILDERRREDLIRDPHPELAAEAMADGERAAGGKPAPTPPKYDFHQGGDAVTSEPRLIVRHTNPPTVSLDGTAYQVTAEQAALMEILFKKAGTLVEPAAFKGHPLLGGDEVRRDRVKKGLPAPLRKLIDGKPGGGYKLTLPETT